MAAKVGQELLNVPFPEMVTKLALGIAQGQTALDENSSRVAKFMAETQVELPRIDNPSESKSFSLLALGFHPAYYEFEESVIEVKMAISMATTTEAKVGVSARAGWGPFAASVNASYSRKYSYSVDGSSLLRTKLVSKPAPALLQTYMEALIEKMSKELQDEVAEPE